MHVSSSSSLNYLHLHLITSMDTSQVLFFALLLSLSSLPLLSSDFAADCAECSDRLLGLAPCLAYVQGGGGGAVGAPAPTPSCCMGLKGVVNESPKCLCLLIKNIHEPELGFRINLTLVVSLPALCSAPAANISECPGLLKLAPNSKEAEIFKQLGSAAQQNVKRKEASGAGGGAQASNGGSRWWLGAEMVGQGEHGGAWNFLALLLAIIFFFLF